MKNDNRSYDDIQASILQSLDRISLKVSKIKSRSVLEELASTLSVIRSRLAKIDSQIVVGAVDRVLEQLEGETR